jgi:hypothetical protein
MPVLQDASHDGVWSGCWTLTLLARKTSMAFACNRSFARRTDLLRATMFLRTDRIALFLTEHWETPYIFGEDWQITQERGWLLPCVDDPWESVSLYDDPPTRGFSFGNAVNHFRIQQLLDDRKADHD